MLTLWIGNFDRFISHFSSIDTSTCDFRTIIIALIVLRFDNVFVRRITNMEQRYTEQRYAIKFCVKLGDSVMETYDKLVKVFGDEALSVCSGVSMAYKF